MENDVIDALADIGYEGPLTDPEALQLALEAGPKSPDFTNLVHTLAEELRNLCSLEESVSGTTGPDDASHFLLELSSFLKELGCPYLCLVTGHMSSRLQNKSDRLLLLDYLLSELMAVRMLAVDKPQENSSAMEVTIHETATAKDLKDILAALKMSQPPPNITVNLLFQKLKEKLKMVIQQEGQDYTGKPLYNQSLTEKQWKETAELHKQMVDEYRLRREMLITRLDCTIQSFEWKGNKANNSHERIQAVYRPLRQKMKAHSGIQLSDFLAARSDLLALRKTSDAFVRVNTRSDVNSVVIGRVPDRGGRPSEQQPPPPEMPSWQQQRTQGGGRGGGRGGGGRGGAGSGFGGPGGRVQGGWNQPPADQRSRDGNRGGRGQGFQQDNNKNNYQDTSRGYQGGSNRGGYSDVNRGGYNDGNRGGYNDGNRGGYNDGNRGGYSDGIRGGYSDGNRGGYSDGNRGGYSDGNRGRYNDGNRGGFSDGNRGGYQDNRSNQGSYQDDRSSQSSYDSNRGSSAGYQSSRGAGYQTYVVQQDQGQVQSYQAQGGNQAKGKYQNEHDDRTNYPTRGGSAGRGRSSYNRGGRN